MSRILRAAAVPFAVAVLAAACGSDEGSSDANVDDTSGATTSTPTDAASEPAGEPIKLSMIGIISGPAGSEFMSAGAEAAAQAINDAGGVDGRPIEILACDGSIQAVDPTAGTECANDAIDAGVIATISKTNADDNTTNAFLDAGIASIAPFPIGSADLGAEGSYPFKSVYELIGAAALLADEGAETIRMLAFQTPATGFTASLANEALRPRGLDLGDPIQVPPDPSTDLTPYIAQATSGTDGLIVALTKDGMIRAIKGARASGYTGLIAAPGQAVTPDLIEELGDDAEGLLAASEFEAVTSTSERVQQFVAEMEAFDPDAPLDEQAINSWAAVHFVAELLETLPTIDAASLMEALPGATVDTGVRPTFELTSVPNPFDLPNVFIDTVQYQRVEDGELVAIGDGEFVNPTEAP